MTQYLPCMLIVPNDLDSENTTRALKRVTSVGQDSIAKTRFYWTLENSYQPTSSFLVGITHKMLSINGISTQVFFGGEAEGFNEIAQLYTTNVNYILGFHDFTTEETNTPEGLPDTSNKPVAKIFAQMSDEVKANCTCYKIIYEGDDITFEEFTPREDLADELPQPPECVGHETNRDKCIAVLEACHTCLQLQAAPTQTEPEAEAEPAQDGTCLML